MDKIFYVLGITIISFLAMGWDKYSAIKGRWRISEKALFLLAMIGGGLGILLGMILFHHKTKKRAFQFLIPISVILTIYLIFVD